MNNEELLKKKEQIEEMLKKVENTYHQLLGQRTLIDELLNPPKNES